MKICVIGSGAQGTAFASLMAREKSVDKIVISDYKLEAAQKAGGFINRFKKENHAEIVVEQVNAQQFEDIKRIASGCDLIFNATIPCNNVPIMKACLKLGANYMDLLSLPLEFEDVPFEETVEGQLVLDQEFKDAGLTAIPNCGMSPGWTDLAAAYIAEGMDSVDKMIIRWADVWDCDELIASFSPGVMFGEWFGSPYPLAMVDGEAKEIDLLESEEVHTFPDPVGSLKLHTVTVHPEIVTFPKFIDKPIHWVEEKGGMRIGNLTGMDWWVKAIREQTASLPGKREVDMVQQFGASFMHPTEFEEAYKNGVVKDANAGFCVEAFGIEAGTGNKLHHTVYCTLALKDTIKYLPWCSMGAYATVGGTCREIALMLGNGEITRKGVLGVATLDDPKGIMARAAAKGQKIYEYIERSVF